MTTMKTLLAATDFSDDARHAVHRAALIAVEQRARLELLHVMSGPSLNALRELFPSSVDAEAKLVNDAKRTLDELAADVVKKTGAAVTAQVKVGRVLDEIISSSERSDMLVLGAHGMNPLRDLILGTTAERLLRKCMHPTLVVKCPPRGPYQRVIVPVDFSAYSVAALRMALLVAPKANITLVHAFDVPFEGKLWLAGVAEEKIQEYRIQARQLALSNIDTLIKNSGADLHRFNRMVERDSAATLILAQEARLGADLIVIGKRGQSIIEETLLGSVTRHVISDAKCDVLVVHRHGQ